ncbi:MAG TPA: chloride channel protein [Kofleriaceae bacterium]|nr:chloride channel protein [Kofleriaceae bacterium]
MGAHISAQTSSPPIGGAVDVRVAWISAGAIMVAAVAAGAAQLLTYLIAAVTNLAFHGRLSIAEATPWDHTLGAGLLLVPVAGALVVGVMARWGSPAIRGHGIPEAMEQILFNQSRIPARMVILKPLSAAIAIGTGGPFGAEGPIIATGGALGSLAGQLVPVTADERKILLAAGAAAGMSATFGSPVAAVLLAIELLLFEYRVRSLVPVALAAVTAASARIILVGDAPAFAIADLAHPPGGAMLAYAVVGALAGVAAVLATRLVYAIEDGFARLPLHWMWWPALGALAVGAAGLVEPRVLGVGYRNITDLLDGRLALAAVGALAALKLVAWSIALGSGTSGGTLAPLFTIGAAVGALLGAAGAAALPGAGIDPRVAALVGMAAIFAGASRALLASVVFAFETTRQPLGLLPILAGCAASYLVANLLMRHSIMTEKIARRGRRAPTEYVADHLAQVLIEDGARPVVTLAADDTVAATRDALADAGVRHHGYPVVDRDGALVGVVTRHDLAAGAPEARVRALVTRPPVVVFPGASLRDVADLMVRAGVGRIPIVAPGAPPRLLGIVTRSDLLAAHAPRLDAENRVDPGSLELRPRLLP